MQRTAHSVRIIGGRWRGRRLPVPDQAGLRPTKDIVRETLFNWLQPHLPGSRCLDLFAGSGALGFEAASRDAAEVVLVEAERRCAEALRTQAGVLGAANVAVECQRAEQYLLGAAKPFDVVFLDPPFGHDLLVPACRLLAERGWLRVGARVYIETARQENLPELPAGWQLLREKFSGDVRYALTAVEGAA